MQQQQCFEATAFTPVPAIAGGTLIGISAGFLLLFLGRLAGLSGILGGVLNLEPLQQPKSGAERESWKFSFACGLGLATFFMVPASGYIHNSWPTIAVGGFLVGFGTRLGNGCTSGHGVCGLARLSQRSFLAVLTFMTSAVAVSSIAHPRGWVCSGESRWWDGPNAELRTTALGVCTVLGLLPWFYCEGKKQWRQHVAALLCGGTFSIGLILSGMVQPAKIVNFLQPGRPGGWDPSLLLVMGSAVPFAHILFRVALSRREGPLLCASGAKQAQFSLPVNTQIESRLIIGAWLFGAGWGLSGVCPGPAWVLGALGHPKIACGYLPAMALGMRLAPAAAKLRMPTQLCSCEAKPETS